MSSLESELQSQVSSTKLSPRLVLLGLVVITVVALLVCVAVSPWDSPARAALISALSAGPLGFLLYLSIRIYRTYERIHGQLNRDLDRCEYALLPTRAFSLKEQMRGARGASALMRDGNASTPVALSEPIRRSDLTRTTETYVLQRYVAGEDLRLDEIDKYLREAALDQVQPLQRDHELAFLAGIAGTVLGVVVQISLMPGTVGDQTFLTGVVVKGCSTFVGVMVALYARDMRQRLLDDYDSLVEALVQYASFYLAPCFIDISTDRAAVSEVLRRTIEDLKTTVERVKTNLSDALALAVQTASKDLGKKLKETFATELSEAIKEQITKPFHTEVEGLKTAISQSGESIAAGVRGLNEGTREFKQEAHKLSQASNGMGGQLAEASNVLKFLTQKFEEIVGHADLVSEKLKESQRELALAIERAQNTSGNHNGDDWMRVELEKVLADSRKDRQVHAEMIDRLVGDAKAKRRTT